MLTRRSFLTRGSRGPRHGHLPRLRRRQRRADGRAARRQRCARHDQRGGQQRPSGAAWRTWPPRNRRDGSFGTNGYSGNAALTSLAGLAFMAGGHQPDRGQYGRVVTGRSATSC